MYKVIGKAYYSVTFNDQLYPKVRYTLELHHESLEKFDSFSGVLCDTIILPLRPDTDLPQLDDLVAVSTRVYNGVVKPSAIFVIS